MKFSKEIKESKQLCDEVAKDISKHIFDFVFKELLEIVATSFTGEKLNAVKDDFKDYPKFAKYIKYLETKEKTERELEERVTKILTPGTPMQLILQEINKGNIRR